MSTAFQLLTHNRTSSQAGERKDSVELSCGQGLRSRLQIEGIHPDPFLRASSSRADL